MLKAVALFGFLHFGVEVDRDDTPRHIATKDHIVAAGEEHHVHRSHLLFLCPQDAIREGGGSDGKVKRA